MHIFVDFDNTLCFTQNGDYENSNHNCTDITKQGKTSKRHMFLQITKMIAL